MKKKVLSLILTASMLLSLAGCGKSEGEQYIPNSGKGTNEETKNEITKDDNLPSVDFGDSEVITVADIKAKYGTLDKKEIKPFYNVDQRTQFTFHFNSTDLEPSHAVTVHTDSKCEVNSMVYQINDGYLVNDGLDVVVKPGSPVLQSMDDNTRYTWGKAPVYYLSINYDMDATTPTKLDTPIIVPFTIKSNVSTPNVTASIDTHGKFQIQWKPVEGAVKYNIYDATAFEGTPGYGMSRAECAYQGDHLDLIATVDGSVTTFDEFTLDNGSNILEETDGYIFAQNQFLPGNYYVSAVDASGNESQYSMAVSAWKFKSQLPDTFSRFTGFEKNSSGNVSKLPEEVMVTMRDKSTASFPINFKKVGEEYGCGIYEYEVVGTLLTGKVTYENESQTYPDEVVSGASVNYGLYQVKNDINIIPDVALNTINDDSYSNSVVSLDKQVEYPESSKLAYDSDALMIRADMEAARMIRDGLYSDGYSPLDITYRLDEQSATPYVKDNTQELPKNEQSSEENQPSVNGNEQPSEQPSEEDTQPTNENVQSNEEDAVPEEITSENLVQEQINSTQKEVEEANKQDVPQAQVMYFADTAEEEYVTMMMIARQEAFDVSAFPSLQNTEYLMDVMEKVIFQNPYIISPLRYGYAPEYKAVVVEYAYSPEETFRRQSEISQEVEKITSSIITSGMSNEEKVNAVWKYLEDNTKYDNAALEAAEANNFGQVDGFEDAFNAYGIMCKKVGVCQSYSYCYKLLLAEAGVPCVTLTGFLDKTLPHAWNAVQLSGSDWYWLDATNNKNVTGIPYYLYQTSSTNAIESDYVLDNMYDLDDNLEFVMTDDNSKDWWYENSLCVESTIDIPGAFVRSYKLGATSIDGMNVIAVKNIGNIQDADLTEDVITRLVQALYAEGMTEEQLMNTRMGNMGSYIALIY